MLYQTVTDIKFYVIKTDCTKSLIWCCTLNTLKWTSRLTKVAGQNSQYVLDTDLAYLRLVD